VVATGRSDSAPLHPSRRGSSPRAESRGEVRCRAGTAGASGSRAYRGWPTAATAQARPSAWARRAPRPVAAGAVGARTRASRPTAAPAATRLPAARSRCTAAAAAGSPPPPGSRRGRRRSGCHEHARAHHGRARRSRGRRGHRPWRSAPPPPTCRRWRRASTRPSISGWRPRGSRACGRSEGPSAPARPVAGPPASLAGEAAYGFLQDQEVGTKGADQPRRRTGGHPVIRPVIGGSCWAAGRRASPSTNASPAGRARGCGWRLPGDPGGPVPGCPGSAGTERIDQ